METRRQKQVGALIQRNFSTVLQQEGSYLYGTQALVSVTHVIMSPDLGLAKIYVSVWNIENKQAVVLQMDQGKARLKKLLSERIRKHVRRIPRIDFYIDETLDEIEHVEHIFDKIKGTSQSDQEE